MSTLTLHSVNDNKLKDVADYQNAHGFHPRIWRAMFNEYIKPENYPYHSILHESDYKRL